MIPRDMVPPGGWVFHEGDIEILGDTFKELKEMVEAHRVNNKKPMGNVEEDIINQISERFPNLVIY